MKKEKNVLKLIIPAIFSFSLAAFGRAPATYNQVRNELVKVTQKNLIDHVNRLVSVSAPSRMVGKPGHDKARNYLVESIKAADPKNTGTLKVMTFQPDIEEAKNFYQKEFQNKVEGKIPSERPAYQKWFRFTSYIKTMAESLKTVQGSNIIWEKIGLNPNKTLLITAHYDTITLDTTSLTVPEHLPMPGANYNASSVAVGLNLIHILSQIDLNYSVQIVFLDWQSIGFLGSLDYAKELKLSKTNLLGFINLEMLGQDTSFFDKTKKKGNLSVYYRPEDESFVRKLNDHGSKITSKVTFEMKALGFEQSDNFRFWDQGFIGATYSQNWEDDFNPKFFQTQQDTPETLNHETLYHAYQYLGGAVLGTLLDITK